MSDDIDFSNEGLGLGIEDAPAEETPDAPVEAEAPVEAPEAEATVEDELPEQEAGESAEDYATRYAEAQKLIGRQGQELGELRAMLEQIQAQQAEQYDDEEEWEDEDDEPFAFQGRVPQTQDELIEMAASPDGAIEAYQFALENTPHLLPDVLAEVQFHDPGLAKRMEMDLYAQMLQSTVAPIHEQYQHSTAEQQVAEVVTDYAQQVEGFDDMREEVAAIIEEEPWLVGDGSPQAVQNGLRAATRMAQQARQVAATHAQAQQQAQGVQQRQQAAVETGTPSAAPAPQDTSPEDAIRDAIFAEDKRRRELF